MHKLSMHTYLDKLFSHDTDPGGGVATAFTGAQAAALLSMVAGISQNRNQGKNESINLDELMKNLEEVRENLMKLATEDAKAFGGVRQCYRMPNQTPDEKKKRNEAMQIALKQAARIPLKVMENISRLYDYAEILIPVSGVALVTDIGIAVLLMDASMYSSNFNVKINLKYIKDPAEKDHLSNEVHRMIRDKKRRKEALIEKIKKMIQ